MLVIASDLHLGDGTTAAPIPASAFHLFARRLRETAHLASLRDDGTFRPITDLDVVLMGDIIDPLHSTRWLDTAPAGAGDVRPWSDPADPRFAAKLAAVTRAVLETNRDALYVLRGCATGRMVYLSPDPRSQERIPIKVRLHYMVGNHDWYYRLPGAPFDRIRQEVIETLGLANDPGPFPHNPEEAPHLMELFARHRLMARHGDHFDRFNFDPDRGRNHATLGDAFTMAVCNRFPVEVQRRFGAELPAAIVDSLRRITNIRPALATPLWIGGQIRQHAGSAALEDELKRVWDEIAAEFLDLPFVQECRKGFVFNMVDAMRLLVTVTRRASFGTIHDVLEWVRSHMWQVEHSFASHALREPAFTQKTARYFVYGHTHQHEIVPLDLECGTCYETSQIYFNSGTWHSYYDLAIRDPAEQKFVRYDSLTYLTFYAPSELGAREFEAWSGVYA